MDRKLLKNDANSNEQIHLRRLYKDHLDNSSGAKGKLVNK